MKRFTLLLIMAIVATTNICSAQGKRENTNQVNRISTLLHEDRFDEGEVIVDSMLRLYPQNSDMLHLKAICYSTRKEGIKSIECYNKAIENVTSKSYYNKAFLLFCRGAIYSDRGVYEVAINDYNQAMDTAKKDDAWLHTRIRDYRAECYYYQGEYDKAEQDLMAIIVTTDEERFVQSSTRNLCDVYLASRQYNKAILVANGLLEMDCYHHTAYYTLAIANLEVGNTEVGIDRTITMMKVDIGNVEPDEIRWMLWHDVEYAREVLHRHMAEDVDNMWVGHHLAIAEIVYDYDTMVSLFDKCANEYEADQLLYWKADYSAKAGKYDDAVRYITELISGEDDAEDILYLTTCRCEYFRLAGKYAEAIKDAESLIEQYPDYAYGYYICGWCHELMGDDTKAMVYYNKGIDMDDSYAYIYLMRGEQYLKAGNIEQANSDFRRVLELDTEAVDGSARHYALHFLGRNKEAVEWMDRIIEVLPYDCGTYYDAACLYARMGNIERSLDSLHLALYLGYKAKAHIENDDDLDPIRHTEEFKSLMEQYFN